jgi:hypothetical protein
LDQINKAAQPADAKAPVETVEDQAPATLPPDPQPEPAIEARPEPEAQAPARRRPLPKRV